MSSSSRKPIAIPVVVLGDQQVPQVAGGFCSTRDAVTDEELAALERLRALSTRARQVRDLLAQVTDADARRSLEEEWAALRAENQLWQQRRREATQEKHARLGHVTLGLE
ncbi:MAG: hypothetical protein H7831_05690 [Magnetococcus sp. WYHC-3]